MASPALRLAYVVCAAAMAATSIVLSAAQAQPSHGSIVVSLIDRVGPIPGRVAVLRSADSSIQPAILSTARTDRAGRVVFDDLPPGRFTLTVPPTEFNGVRLTAVQVVEGRATETSIALTLPMTCECIVFIPSPEAVASERVGDRRGLISGHVADNRNIALPFARIQVDGFVGYADVNGFYQMLVDSGSHDMSVSFPNFRVMHRPVIVAPRMDTREDFQVELSTQPPAHPEETLGANGCRCGSTYGPPDFERDGLLFTPIVMPRGLR